MPLKFDSQIRTPCTTTGWSMWSDSWVGWTLIWYVPLSWPLAKPVLPISHPVHLSSLLRHFRCWEYDFQVIYCRKFGSLILKALSWLRADLVHRSKVHLNMELQIQFVQYLFKGQEIQWSESTGLLAYSDSPGTLKKCHCKRGASHCVTVSKHFYYMKGQSVFEKVTVSNHLLNVSL